MAQVKLYIKIAIGVFEVNCASIATNFFKSVCSVDVPFYSYVQSIVTVAGHHFKDAAGDSYRGAVTHICNVINIGTIWSWRNAVSNASNFSR